MAGTPGALGYRWPAEWEPHVATWLAWPHNEETWPGRLPAARTALAAFARELSFREAVRVLVCDEPMAEAARADLASAGADLARVELHRIPTDDAWLRDTGPVFVVRDAERGAARRALVDFRFDCWGGKYEPFDRDDAVPRAVAERLGMQRFAADFVLEAGSIDGDGAGSVLTTESCLLHSNREPGRSRARMEERLGAWLGARSVLWLEGGIAGDDTDGHVDDVARFVAPGQVVAVECSDASDPDFAPLAENLRRLRASRDARGAPLGVATLPAPPPLRIAGHRVPASYANFYIANGCVLVPVFGAAADARALDVLGELFPDRDVVGLAATDLVVGLGAFHCLSQQEPR